MDIGGVKVGMDYETTVNALVDYYDVQPDSMKVVYMPAADVENKERTPLALSLESNPTEGIRIGLPSSGWVITVSFVPMLNPTEKNSVEVNAIEYEMAWTQENIESLSASVLEKYGVPTVDQQSMGFQWCSEPSTHWAICESEAILTYSGSSLKLQDSRPRRLLSEEQDKLNSKKARI